MTHGNSTTRGVGSCTSVITLQGLCRHTVSLSSYSPGLQGAEARGRAVREARTLEAYEARPGCVPTRLPGKSCCLGCWLSSLVSEQKGLWEARKSIVKFPEGGMKLEVFHSLVASKRKPSARESTDTYTNPCSSSCGNRQSLPCRSPTCPVASVQRTTVTRFLGTTLPSAM